MEDSVIFDRPSSLVLGRLVLSTVPRERFAWSESRSGGPNAATGTTSGPPKARLLGVGRAKSSGFPTGTFRLVIPAVGGQLVREVV